MEITGETIGPVMDQGEIVKGLNEQILDQFIGGGLNLINRKEINEIDKDGGSGSQSSLDFEGGDLDKENESDIDNIDFENFKGIYIDEDPNRKY